MLTCAVEAADGYSGAFGPDGRSGGPLPSKTARSFAERSVEPDGAPATCFFGAQLFPPLPRSAGISFLVFPLALCRHQNGLVIRLPRNWAVFARVGFGVSGELYHASTGVSLVTLAYFVLGSSKPAVHGRTSGSDACGEPPCQITGRLAQLCWQW
jgi:hypothetical protein